MKKSILFFALALIGMSYASAQKQEGGDKNFEFTFAPLGGNPIGINGIRLRSFNGDGTGAIRLGIFVGGTSETTINSQPGEVPTVDDQDKSPELLDVMKTFDFSIRPGYEKHWDGTDRLSPYIGGELFIGMGSESLNREFYSPNDTDQLDNFVTWNINRKQGHTTIGLNLLAGFDFYFSDYIYLGAEMGFGYSSTKLKDRETEVSDNEAFVISILAQSDSDFSQAFVNENGEVEYATIIGDGSGSWKNAAWGPNVQGTIRLGVLIN